MAKHQVLSARSRRTRTLIGGVMAGGVLALAAPAGLAFADTPGDTVGRPDRNLAPGVRAAQAIGDATFNDDTPLSKAINRSPLGTAYHKAFGQRGTPIVDPDGNVIAYKKEGRYGGLYQGRSERPARHRGRTRHSAEGVQHQGAQRKFVPHRHTRRQLLERH